MTRVRHTPTGTVHDTVRDILASRSSGESFTPGRYPFTYAYDFFRAHAAEFGADPSDDRVGSRSGASGLVTEYANATGQKREDVLVALADAYLELFHVRATAEERQAALDAAYRESWRSLGADGPRP